MLLLMTGRLADEVDKASKLGPVSGWLAEEVGEGSSSTCAATLTNWDKLVCAYLPIHTCEGRRRRGRQR